MISWIQRTFQRHLKIVLVLMTLAMCIPLIVIFTPSGGMGGGGYQGMSRDFFGYNLGSQADQARMIGDAQLSAALQLGQQRISSDQLEQYAMQRAAALYLANQWRLPQPGTAAVSAYIQQLPAFADANGQFDAARYASFRDSLQSGGGMNGADVSRVISDDVRIEQVRRLLAGPGYVLDQDVKTQLARAHTTWTLNIATLSYAAFKPDIKPSANELAQFFGENSFRYQIPPEADVSYLLFPAKPYLSSAPVADDDLQAFFNANLAHFPVPAATAQDPKATRPATAADFSSLKNQVLAAYRLDQARQQASKAASDLTLAIYDSNLAKDSPGLQSLLAAHHLTAQPLPPFTEEQGPAQFDNAQAIAHAAFNLNDDRYFSDPIPVAEGAIVLLWHQTLPAHDPQLQDVIGRVTADCIEQQKRERFVALGSTLYRDLRQSLQSGRSFADAVATAQTRSPVAITVKNLPAFEPVNPPKDLDYAVFGSLDNLKQGRVSPMIIANGEGLFVYAAGEKLPDLSPANPAYDQTRRQIAAITSRIGSVSYLTRMVQDELKRTAPKTN